MAETETTPAANANTSAAPVAPVAASQAPTNTPAPVEQPTKASDAPVKATDVKNDVKAEEVKESDLKAERSPLDPEASQETPKQDEPAKKEEEKHADEKKADDVFDEKDLKLPEGFTLDAKKDKPILDALKEAKFSKEKAQALFDRYTSGVKEALDVAQKASAERTNAYFNQSLNSFKNDPVLGGKNFEATIQGNRKVIDAVTARLPENLQAELKTAIYGTKENGFNGLGKSHAFNAFLAEIHKAGFVEAKPSLNDMSSGKKTSGLSTATVMQDPKAAMRAAGILSSKK